MVAAASAARPAGAGLEGLLIVGISAAAGAKIAVIVPPWLSALHCAGFLVDGASAGRHIGVHRVSVLPDIVHSLLPAGHPMNGHPMIQIYRCNSVHWTFPPPTLFIQRTSNFVKNTGLVFHSTFRRCPVYIRARPINRTVRLRYIYFSCGRHFFLTF